MPRTTYRKKLTDEDLSSQFNPENVKLIERFLKEKNNRSSALTIRGYSSDLTIFQTWNLLNNSNKNFVDVRKIELADFFSFGVEEMHWGSARFSRMKSTLSSLSNFIEKFFDEEYKDFRNIVLRAVESMPKNPTREKTVLSEKQIDDLFVYLDEINEPQIACWVALAIGSGSRFSELLRFTTDIIDINNTAFDGIFLETTKSIKTKGRGKSGKMLVKYIIKDIFYPRYEKWIVVRDEIMQRNKKEHNFVFIKSNGDPAGDATVRGWIEKMEKFLDVPVYPHLFRHWSTTYLSRKQLPYELIKELFGWSSTLMCEIYDDATVKDKKWEGLGNLKQDG
jgi:site-specific recombinase XerD